MQLGDRQLDRLVEACPHRRAQAAAEVVEHRRLDADQRDPRRKAVADAGQRQQLLEGRLVQAHRRRRTLGNLAVAKHVQRPRREAEVDRVEDDDALGRADVVEQVHPLRSAVDDRHVGRHLPALVQCFDRANAEALVGPEHVADAEHQHVGTRFVRFDSGADVHGTLSAWRCASR
jgi:hypothetical protein